ncbi:hypothetical protein [uncultured Dokdonia sp.]|uniref:hypothetical protein n=1 Tax=uncultured Dokdonia sp. TaxID=575653 RepID=UPI00261ED797|nr:hypothetical protein [uncultured Dokdonia sp.]
MEKKDREWFIEVYNNIFNPISDVKSLDVDNRKLRAVEIDFSKFENIDDKTILRFYKCLNWWKIFWKTKPESNIQAEGSFEIIPFEKMMTDAWDDDLGGNDWAPDMKGFRPLDLFYDSDGFVGFYIGREDKKGLYLVHSDSSVSPLHVDFEGYLELLSLSRGFGWWQNTLVEISTGKHQPNVDIFKENMPKIFPDFDYKEFKNLYESLRIDS